MTDKISEMIASLSAKEDKLITLIAATDNEELYDTFLDWQDLRNKLNSINLLQIEKSLK